MKRRRGHALRRRYGRAKSSSWVMGRAPSHLELFSHGKPLAIHKIGRKWGVSLLGAPVVRGSSGLTFRGRAGFEEGMPVAQFDTKEDAKHVAHKIGRYMLNLGDMAFLYVEGW